MSKYNGHKNYNHWNVSLWISNDESLYRLAQYWIEAARNREEAAEYMLQDLRESGVTATPDGAPYSKTTLQAAMRGM